MRTTHPEAKPLNHDELLTRVRSLLRIKRYHDTIKAQAAELLELNRTLEERVGRRSTSSSGCGGSDGSCHRSSPTRSCPPATEQTAAERAQARQFRAAFAEWTSRRRPAHSNYEAWLDERNAPRLPLTRADLHSQHDQTAADVVSRGGGIQAVIDATDLRTLDNVARLIDPVIVTRAFDKDLLEQTQPSPLPLKRHRRLRRLVPDAQLLQRRAAGQPLRALACDYHVTHTTLSRYFARLEIKQQLRQTLGQLQAQQRTHSPLAAPPSGRIRNQHTSSSHTELR